jgi:hypothetical protein
MISPPTEAERKTDETLPNNQTIHREDQPGRTAWDKRAASNLPVCWSTSGFLSDHARNVSLSSCMLVGEDGPHFLRGKGLTKKVAGLYY